MSACNHILELSEQICYVQCNFCDTILLVSVPCGSLLKMVTVRCGHCANLLSVNMLRASFVPLQILSSLNDHEQKHELCGGAPPKSRDHSPAFAPSNDEEKFPVNTINKPPEKRQRAPSAYNRFIKEEIQRLKASEPSITHKEAFSTAAKNWAHFPRIQYRGAEAAGGAESCSQGGHKESSNANVDEVHVQSEGFRERKVSRHSMCGKKHF